MRIYITRMSFENEEHDAQFYSKAYALISALKTQNHEIVYISDNEFNDYKYVGIYKALSSCDCLLAFTDCYTCSSTWRVSEITYAINGAGAFEKVDFHIPVFLYRGIDNHNSLFIDNLIKQPDVYVLPDDINVAWEEIR